MRKDPTEFRKRFVKWKAGEKVYENGLPKYGDGTTNVIPEDLQGLSDPQFQPQIDAAKVQMTPFVVDDTAYRAQKYHPGTTREQVQELYNNTPYIGSYNKGMLASPSIGAYFSNRDDHPFIRIGQNKPYEIDQMIAHESGHALEDLLFHGRTQQELDLLNKAYGGLPGTKYNEFGQLNRELRHLISKNNNNVIGKDLDNIITNMKDKDLLWLLKNNNLGYTKGAGQMPNLDASAIKKALLDVAQNKYTFDQGNGIMLAKNGKSATLAIPQITNMQNGLPAYGGGKSTKKGPYVKGVVYKPVYDEFDTFLQTLPDNQRALGAYNTRRYWELNGKPKDFAEAIGKGMYSVKNDNGVLNWHGNSVAYNEDNDAYEFMKPNYHPTRWMEQVYGYDQSPEFQKDWKVQYNGPMLSDRYVRREKPGLKIKGGQLPRFAMGTEGDKRKSTKGNRFVDMSAEELEAQSKAAEQYWENKQRELSNRSSETIRQMGIDADKEYRKRNPDGGQPDPKLQRANDLVVSSMKSRLPFTGEDYKNAANEQRQHSLDKWHDYKKGIEATAKAAELTLSAGTLVGAYANWKRWKDLANVARPTFSQLTKSKIANLLQKAQLPMQASGTVIDGVQTYDALQNNDSFNAWWNGLSTIAGVGGSIGAADLFNNARLSYPVIDRIFDTSGIIQSAADVLKYGTDYMTNTQNELRNK